MLGTIADFAGIASFILTTILLIRSEKLRNEIVSQKLTYRSQQAVIVAHLNSFRNSLANNEDLSLKAVSEMRTELNQFDINFRHMLSRRDQKLLKQTINFLDDAFSDASQKAILKNLDYFSARFTKQEV